MLVKFDTLICIIHQALDIDTPLYVAIFFWDVHVKEDTCNYGYKRVSKKLMMTFLGYESLPRPDLEESQ